MLCLCIVFFLHNNLVLSRRGKFLKDGTQVEDENEVGRNTTEEQEHMKEHIHVRKLRYEASIIVLIIFFFITFGMFLCCRYLPELIMDKI